MPASTIEVFIYEKTYRIFNNEYAKGRWDRAGNIYNSK